MDEEREKRGERKREKIKERVRVRSSNVWRKFTHDCVARFGGAAGLSSRVEKHVGPAVKEARSSLDAHRADVPLQPSPLCPFMCTHTINGSRRKKISGGFLGVVTEGPKRMSRDRGDLHTVSRGKGWFRVEIVEIRLNGYAIVSRIINIVIWNFTNNNINIIRLG